MIKTKIIQHYSDDSKHIESSFEKELNEFLATIPSAEIVDIKYQQMTVMHGFIFVSALIIYKQ